MKKILLSSLTAVVLGTLGAADGMKIYPNGEEFLFTGYSPSAGMYKNLKADGFTAVGPVYTEMSKMMISARSAGLPVIYSIKGPYSKKHLQDKNQPFDPAEIEKAVTEEVKAAVAAHSDHIYAWYLRPEELRHWRKREYSYLQIVAAAIRKGDPLKRPVWMYNPGHYSAASLQKYLPHLTIMGKGTYTNYSGFRSQRIWVRYSIGQQRKAVKAAGSDAPVIAVLEMFRPPDKKDIPEIGKWVRHDVYCALISGAKGIVVYSLWPRSGFRNAGHPQYYQAYKACALELTGETGLGKVFLHGKEISDITLSITEGQKEEVLSVHKTKVSYPAVNSKALEYNGKKYLFVVNSVSGTAGCRISGLPAGGILQEVNGKRTYKVDQDGSILLSLAPLEVMIATF